MPEYKRMYNKDKVITGLIIFLAVMTFPFWYNHGKAAPAPKIELTKEAKAAKQCVRDKDYMKTEHMQLLDEWRDVVVREGKRMYVNTEGKEFNMSLSNSCLECHSNKAEFCDRCHDYASADPYCWDCHIDNPKEKK
ncbi:putative redox complex linked to DsrAB, cytochrome c subunit [Desulfonema limicola]|uniref:Redox complex linked to DsrAB, cytochrome c subunit n=1 Tax=Desulfonema limicola TaxID=45656 RepID=A0A975GJM0_9BACT|nr:sulfate reduction electron transfer complex DsrMKJOP subunit DsrJ [Desulfonema limicola]QTA83669.1 putative redox complex linked to DsrAB, cytochrome c subunit [Desulfonema limicola]